jgi:hypothetical protein
VVAHGIIWFGFGSGNGESRSGWSSGVALARPSFCQIRLSGIRTESESRLSAVTLAYLFDCEAEVPEREPRLGLKRAVFRPHSGRRGFSPLKGWQISKKASVFKKAYLKPSKNRQVATLRQDVATSSGAYTRTTA